jgi:signal transduction histidine kinase
VKLTRKKKRPSISSRYTILYTAGQLILLLFIVIIFFGVTGRVIFDQQKQIIQSNSDSLAEFYEIGGEAKLTELLEYRLKKAGDPEALYLLTDKFYQPVLGNIPEWPVDVPKDIEWGEIDWFTADEEIDLMFYHRVLNDGRHLLVAQTNSQIEHYGDFLHRTVLSSLLVAITIGFILGWLLRRQLRKRFEIIEETCQKISEGQLTHRMDFKSDGDEIDHMAETINSMLDRIEQLMGGIQHVTNNIAHDLRTPLTRLRGRLELLHNRMEEGEDQKEIASSLEDVDDLLSTFQALMNISRLESGQVKKDFTEVSLPSLVTDAIEFFEPLAETKGQSISSQLEEAVTVIGDNDLLFQCVANILDNAIKYSPKDSEIDIKLTVLEDSADLEVRDQGCGIPEAELEKVFERFYRVEQSRNEKGSGLGLSMVSAILELHNARISLKNNNGLSVKVTFPVS